MEKQHGFPPAVSVASCAVNLMVDRHLRKMFTTRLQSVKRAVNRRD